jgi:uncharacterized coiled-coil DUF342 family protein
MRLEVAEARSSSNGPDPKVSELQEEIERLRYQLASARADAGQLREERDELRQGMERALGQFEKQ